MNRPRNWALFTVVVFAWGLNWSVMKAGLDYVDPLNFAFHRFLIASLALLPLLAVLRARVPRDARNLALLVGLGLFNAGTVVLVLEGMVYESSSLSAVLAHTQPLFVILLAVPLLRERLTVLRGLGLCLGFTGLIVFSMRNETLSLEIENSLLLLLAGAFLWAVTVVYYKRFLSHVDPVVVNVLQLWVGVAVVAPFNFATTGFVFPETVAYIPIILFSSLAAFALALTLWIHLLREEEATVLSFSGLIIPMVALLFGWLLLHEHLGLPLLIGAALILLGVYLVNRPT